MKLLIQNGVVYAAGALRKADVLVEGGFITGVGPGLAAAGAVVLNATGCVVCGGFTDLHTHLREPGFEAKETVASGTAAAAAGGFTTVCAMPNLAPVPDNERNLRRELDAIGRHALVRVLPYGALTVGEKGARLARIGPLSAYVAGFSDDGFGVQSETMMRRAMVATAASGRFIAAHCEVNALLPQDGVTVQAGSAFAAARGWAGVPNESEWREAARNIRLAEETGCRLHICHASTAETFALVYAAKARAAPVSCEVTPHNLLLNCDDIAGNDGRWRMNPPLRAKADVDAAVAALLDGTVDAIATDHAPHTAAEKAGGFAQSLNGVVGLETAFPALYTGLVLGGALPLERLLALMIEGPRALLGEAPPRIAPGCKANLTVLDLATKRPVKPERFKSKGRATPFAGQVLRGWPVLTMYEGRVVYRSS